MILYKNSKATVRSPDGDTDWSLVRRYINTIFVRTLLRVRSSRVKRSNKRKSFHTKKDKT